MIDTLHRSHVRLPGLIIRQVRAEEEDNLPSVGRQYRYPPKSGWVKHFHANGLLRMPLRLDKNRFSNRESSYSRGASREQRDSPYYSPIRF